jgi:membrane protease YdiL (CAAX protease family)
MTSEPESEFKDGAEPEGRPPEDPVPVIGEGQPVEELPPAPTFAMEPHRARPVLAKLQQTWRLLLYLFLALVILPSAATSLATSVLGRQRGSLSPEFLLFIEVFNFAATVVLTILLAFMEQAPWGGYGLPWKQAFQANFWVGMLLGLAEASVVIGLIELFGGFTLEGWALRGSAMIGWALFHFVLFVFVGLYEEFLFRGYPQAALSKLIGFWPAAIALSVGFGLVHLSNRGENWVGAVSVMLVGLLFAFTLKRTGNLWYAVGLHAGFDWAQSFLYSVPDSGEVLQGHLWNTSLHGPDWLTGGTVGPEGSVFCFLTMVLQFLVVFWLFPAKTAEPVPETPAPVESD